MAEGEFFAQFGGGGGGGGLKELEVGVTPIINGNPGRILFQGTGNVLQESDNLYWDETNFRLGIRTTQPDCSIDVRTNGTDNTRGMMVTHYDNTNAFSQAKIIGRRARGTQTTPTAVQQNDSLASFNGAGRKATEWSTTVGGFYIYANQNWTDSATGTYMTFRGVNDGSTTVSEWMRLSQGRLGLGTTNPNYRMVVSQSVGSSSGTSLLSGIETVINPFIASTQGLFIYKNDGSERGFKLVQSGSTDLDSFFKITSSNAGVDADRLVVKRLNGYVGINQTNPLSILDIKADTATATDLALRVNNSSDVGVFLVTNTGIANFTTWGNNVITGNKTIQITGTNTGTHLSITSGSNPNTSTSTEVNQLWVSHIGFAPTSGNADFNQLRVSTVINQTGGANGITRGVFVNPTLTAAANYRAIEITNSTGWGVYVSGASNNYMAGSLALGRTTVGAKLDIQAQGALSTDLAFRVRNSADTDNIIEVRGNNQIVKGTSTVIVPSVQSVTSAATVTPALGNDMVVITAQAVDITLANPTGTWSQGLSMIIRLKDNGTSRAITYDTKYRAIGVSLPTATTVNKVIYYGVIYNSTDDLFDIIGVTVQG